MLEEINLEQVVAMDYGLSIAKDLVSLQGGKMQIKIEGDLFIEGVKNYSDTIMFPILDILKNNNLKFFPTVNISSSDSTHNICSNGWNFYN